MEVAPSASPAIDDVARAAVCQALALGWQIARLFESPLRSGGELTVEEDLPGLSRLPGKNLVELGVAQVEAALRSLGGFLGPHAELPDTSGLRGLIKDSESGAEKIRQVILSFHLDLLTSLTAADFRCGKSYGLGRAVADTCSSSQSASDLSRHLDPFRAAELHGWIDDLKTLLPDHSSEAVSSSLESWVEWGQSNPIGALSDHDLSETSRALHAQGQRWRAVLSGEKDSRDTLKLEDYVSAASGALTRTRQLGGEVIRKLWQPLVLTVPLLALGIALVVAFSGAARVIAGLGAIFAALGISWHGFTSVLGTLGRRVEGPVWGGELDRVIGARITALPRLRPPAVHSPPKEQPSSAIDDTVVQRIPPSDS